MNVSGRLAITHTHHQDEREQMHEQTEDRDATLEESVAMQQASINEVTFEQLRHDHEATSTTIVTLENALDAARARRDVLGAAIEALSKPMQVSGQPVRGIDVIGKELRG